MKRGYRELVGLRVTFSKVVPQYNLEHFYRWKSNGHSSPALHMRGYDMLRTVDIASIVRGLETAYAPAILSVWRQEDAISRSEFLQFDVGARPDECKLLGRWTLWAEW